MKIKLAKIFFALLFLLCYQGNISAQVVSFMKTVEGAETYGLVSDDLGNYYTIGKLYRPTVYFDSIHVRYQNIGDTYIAKFDKEGIAQWARVVGTSPIPHEVVYKIDIDTSGNIYIAGNFTDSTDRHRPDTLGADENGFLGKYDNNGVQQWVRHIYGSSYKGLRDMDADGAGNVVLTGYFYDTITFSDETSLYHSGLSHYIVKYNNQGSVVWATELDPGEYGANVEIHSTGDIYLAGTIDHDVFIARLSENAQRIWTYRSSHMPGTEGPSTSVDPETIDVDAFGNVFVSGTFLHNVVFDQYTFTSQSEEEVIAENFVVKLDKYGSIQFAKHLGETAGMTGSSIDHNGNYYLSVRSKDSIFAGVNLEFPNYQTIIKYNNNGTFIWLKSLPIYIGNIDVNSQGSIYFFASVSIYKADSYTGKITQPDFGVSSFTLINADTDEPIVELSDNDTINLLELPTLNLNVKVNTYPAHVGSIRIHYDQKTMVENVAPYALFGDINGNYKAGAIIAGNHTLTAIAYSDENGGGEEGNSLTIRFVAVSGNANTITGFTLVNADTDEDIMEIVDNDTIDIADLPSSHLNIRANTGNSTGSVLFEYDGAIKLENQLPFSLFGDNHGDYRPGPIGNGMHTLKATSYSGPGASGTPGSALLVNFSVINSSMARLGSHSLSQEGSVSVYPNPANTYIDIKLESDGSSDILVELFDRYGELVKTVNVNAMEDLFKLDTGLLSDGVYVLKCSAPAWTQVTRVVLRR